MKPVAAVALVIVAVLMLAPPAAAAGPPGYLRGYPERISDSCVQWVTQWADGYSRVPLPGCQVWPVRKSDGTIFDGMQYITRIFTEMHDDGCSWLVAQLVNGEYLKEPYQCGQPVVAAPPQATGPAPQAPAEMEWHNTHDAQTAPFVLGGGNYHVRFNGNGYCGLSVWLKPADSGLGLSYEQLVSFRHYDSGDAFYGENNTYNIKPGRYYIDAYGGCQNWQVFLSPGAR